MKKWLIVIFVSMFLAPSNPATLNLRFDIKPEIWERMVNAISKVESNHNDNAVNNKTNALGRYQMLKIYVDDVNRIIGKKKYKYSDRKNPKKAREMFDIYQHHYNPEKDIDKAIILHRGKKSWKYINEVKKEMRK